jgi:transcriptional regulator GlxA family with amidase domain
MADSMHNDSSFNPFDPAEPSRDEALAAVLRRATGDVPVGAVDWDALASRIARALPGRSATTWWGYAERWSRRMLPIALAATLVGAFALWEADEPSNTVVASSGASDVVVDLVQGAPAEDAARSFARTVTANVILVGAEQD